jgi:hypothetical protein
MSPSERFVLGKVVLLWLLIATMSAHAGSTEKLSFEQLIGAADLIVKGRVDELNTRTTRNQGSMTTIVTVLVERQFKGTKYSLVTIEQAGGSAGDVALGVPGLAEFSRGEEVILFLKRQRSGRFIVVGGRQGKFTARIEPASRGTVVEDFAHRSEPLEVFLERLAGMTQGN